VRKIVIANTINLKQVDKVYNSLKKKGTSVGPDLYYLTDKQLTPEIKSKIKESWMSTRFIETENYLLQNKSAVTDVASDTGYILRDKEARRKSR
jgi:hypothetical protein